MICPKCNNEIPKDFGICPNCGLSLKSIEAMNRQQALAEAKNRVYSDKKPVTQPNPIINPKQPKNNKKAKKIRPDFIRFIGVFICMLLSFSDWYSVTVNGDVFGTYSLFTPGKKGIFVLPIFLDILSIIVFAALLFAWFINIKKLVPSLKKVNIKRTLSMIFSALNILVLLFAFISASTQGLYGVTGMFCISAVFGILLFVLCFTNLGDIILLKIRQNQSKK